MKKNSECLVSSIRVYNCLLTASSFDFRINSNHIWIICGFSFLCLIINLVSMQSVMRLRPCLFSASVPDYRLPLCRKATQIENKFPISCMPEREVMLTQLAGFRFNACFWAVWLWKRHETVTWFFSICSSIRSSFGRANNKTFYFFPLI
jgi:hypothetical protein